MKYRCVSLFLCIGLLISGCTTEYNGQINNENAEVLSMNDTPDLSYEVPVSVPHILIDQVGYTTSGRKTAIFRGSELPDEFEVVDSGTGEVVFSGKVKPKERATEAGDLIGYADFTELAEEGSYYIRGSIFGRSYDFDIADDVYDEVFTSAIDVLGNTQTKKINVSFSRVQSEQPEKILQGGWITDVFGNQDLKAASEVMMTAMAAYELYTHSFMVKDEAGVEDTTQIPQILVYLKQQADWMQLLQDDKTGGVYAGIVVKNNKSVPTYEMAAIDETATASFAATMAKFSYIYKKYDQQYASQCLKAADRAWKYINKQQWADDENRQEAPEAIMFSAAVELYRASGWNTYHLYAKKIMETNPTITDTPWATYGSVTYLTTRHAVDRKCCEILMKQLMSCAEDISAGARAGAYLTEGDAELTNTKELLWNMVILSIADYVITNHEYATVIENHLHYFFGCNPGAVCLVQEDGCDSVSEYGAGIQDNIKLNAYHIFMLSQIMNDR